MSRLLAVLEIGLYLCAVWTLILKLCNLSPFLELLYYINIMKD